VDPGDRAVVAPELNMARRDVGDEDELSKVLLGLDVSEEAGGLPVISSSMRVGCPDVLARRTSRFGTRGCCPICNCSTVVSPRVCSSATVDHVES